MLTQLGTAKLPTQPSTVLHTPSATFVGTLHGQLVPYDNKLLAASHAIPLTNASIDHVLPLGATYLVLSHHNAVLYDQMFEEIDRLPFNDISSVDSHPKGLVITTGGSMIVYNRDLEMIEHHKVGERLIMVKTIPNGLICASSSSFYQWKDNEVIKLDIPTGMGFRLRKRDVSIVPVDNDGVIVSRGTSFLHRAGKTTPLEINGKPMSFIAPFLITLTRNHIHLYDLDNTLWDSVLFPNVLDVSICGRTIIAISKDTISRYDLQHDDDIIDDIQDLTKAITLLSKMSYEGKDAKLRNLELQYGIQLFNKGLKKHAMNKLTQFGGDPSIVIPLFPQVAFPTISSEVTPQVDESDLRLLTHFLTTTRRKLSRTPDIYRIFETPLAELRTNVDTTLFNCYITSNPGLIGSLLRLPNHCDSTHVIQVLKEREMSRELIDWYYTNGDHAHVLEMLHDDSQIVSYLGRLKDDDLDLVIKFSKPLIDKEEGVALTIFIEGQHSDTFDRLKVMKFLRNWTKIERIYLEYLIFEMQEQREIVHTTLILLYLSSLKDSTPETGTLTHEKLIQVLQMGKYDANNIIKKVPKNEPFVRTIVLSTLGKHDEVLAIFVNELKDPMGAINHTRSHTETFMKLLKLFKADADTKSILQLLSRVTPTVPIKNVFRTIPEVSIQELQPFLTKTIRKSQHEQNTTLLHKNLLDVHRIAVSYQLTTKENRRAVVNADTKCDVCGKPIGGSVLTYDQQGTVRHFGCKKPAATCRKLKTISMDEFVTL